MAYATTAHRIIMPAYHPRPRYALTIGSASDLARRLILPGGTEGRGR